MRDEAVGRERSEVQGESRGEWPPQGGQGGKDSVTGRVWQEAGVALARLSLKGDEECGGGSPETRAQTDS